MSLVTIEAYVRSSVLNVWLLTTSNRLDNPRRIYLTLIYEASHFLVVRPYHLSSSLLSETFNRISNYDFTCCLKHILSMSMALGVRLWGTNVECVRQRSDKDNKRGVNGWWEIMCSGELHELYPSSNMVSVKKAGKMRWARHAVRMEKWKIHTHFQSKILKKRANSEELGVSGRIRLKNNCKEIIYYGVDYIQFINRLWLH